MHISCSNTLGWTIDLFTVFKEEYRAFELKNSRTVLRIRWTRKTKKWWYTAGPEHWRNPAHGQQYDKEVVIIWPRQTSFVWKEQRWREWFFGGVAGATNVVVDTAHWRQLKHEGLSTSRVFWTWDRHALYIEGPCTWERYGDWQLVEVLAGQSIYTDSNIMKVTWRKVTHKLNWLLI